MPKYLVTTSYSADGVKGVLAAGGNARREAARRTVESIGGTLECFYFAFGSDDTVLIVDLPDNVSAAALGLAVSSSGLVRASTTVLLTPEDIDQATKKTVDYSPPGS